MPNCTAYAWGRFWEIGDPLGTGANKPNPNDLPGIGVVDTGGDVNTCLSKWTNSSLQLICFEDYWW